MFKDLALLSQVKRWLLSREKGLCDGSAGSSHGGNSRCTSYSGSSSRSSGKYSEEEKVAAAKGGNSSRRLCKIYRLSASPSLYLLLGEIA